MWLKIVVLQWPVAASPEMAIRTLASQILRVPLEALEGPDTCFDERKRFSKFEEELPEFK